MIDSLKLNLDKALQPILHFFARMSAQSHLHSAVFRKGTRLVSADLSGAILSEAILTGADLSGAILSEAILTGADLSGTNLSQAILAGVNLSGKDLRMTNLHEADLSGTNLSQAVLCMADLGGADMRETDLHNADLYLTNLRGAKNLSMEQTKAANHWEQAHYDADFRQQLGLPPSNSNYENSSHTEPPF